MLLLKEHSAKSTDKNHEIKKQESVIELKKSCKQARLGSRIYDDTSTAKLFQDIPGPHDLPNLELREGEIEQDKMRKLFLDFDKDGNGRIDRDEFSEFICKLGAKLKPGEIDLIFESVDKDESNYISFEEFVTYFMDCVMGCATDTISESRLRAAFLEADKDRSGSINFKEFYEYVSSVRQSVAIEALTMAYHELLKSDQRGIQFKEFKKFFKRESTMLSEVTEVRHSQDIDKMLKSLYSDTDAAELATYLRSRWEKFTSFKRYGGGGDLVMSGKSGIVDDVVPGNYTFLDLACFNEMSPNSPKMTSIKATWIPSKITGQSGKVIFPNDFDELIPVDIATNENLAYYSCSLADSKQLKISLLYRHGVQDFTYENSYLEDYVKSKKALGGSGIEQHQFAHLDCPFDDDSGYFVVGKLDGEMLHLTAFKVPTKHTLYVPPGVIHSNDYLKGTWRTMLSDEAEIEHCHLVKRDNGSTSNGYKHFTFKFKPYVI